MVILDIIIYALIDMFFPGGRSKWTVKREGWVFIFMNEDTSMYSNKVGKGEEREDILDRDLDAPICNEDFYDGPDW